MLNTHFGYLGLKVSFILFKSSLLLFCYNRICITVITAPTGPPDPSTTPPDLTTVLDTPPPVPYVYGVGFCVGLTVAAACLLILIVLIVLFFVRRHFQ